MPLTIGFLTILQGQGPDPLCPKILPRRQATEVLPSSLLCSIYGLTGHLSISKRQLGALLGAVSGPQLSGSENARAGWDLKKPPWSLQCPSSSTWQSE